MPFTPFGDCSHHLLELSLDDFARIGKKVPVLADLNQVETYHV